MLLESKKYVYSLHFSRKVTLWYLRVSVFSSSFDAGARRYITGMSEGLKNWGGVCVGGRVIIGGHILLPPPSTLVDISQCARRNLNKNS